MSDEFRHATTEEGPKVTDRRKYLEEARREMTDEERAGWEEANRRAEEAAREAPDPNETGYQFEAPEGAENGSEDPLAPKRVHTAFFVYIDEEGKVGVEHDISTTFEATRLANVADFRRLCRDVLDELQAQHTAEIVDMRMQMRAQAMAQQMQAQQVAQQLAGAGGPAGPSPLNRQQRRHPGR
jgi:hypothetical protein